MEVIAFERTQQGTGASRGQRRAGKTPAVVYGAGSAPQSIELDQNTIALALKNEVFHSAILDLKVIKDAQNPQDAQTQQVLLRAVQYHPFKPMVLHLDFQRIDAKKNIHTKVPLHFLNQEISKAVKLSGAVMTRIINDIEITCLPANLPQFIEIDLADMEAGQSLHAKDVKLPKGVALVSHVEQENPLVVSAVVPGATTEEIDADKAAAEGGAAPAA